MTSRITRFRIAAAFSILKHWRAVLVRNLANGEPDTSGGHQKGKVNLVQFLKQEHDPLSSTMVNFLPFFPLFELLSALLCFLSFLFILWLFMDGQNLRTKSETKPSNLLRNQKKKRSWWCCNWTKRDMPRLFTLHFGFGRYLRGRMGKGGFPETKKEF